MPRKKSGNSSCAAALLQLQLERGSAVEGLSAGEDAVLSQMIGSWERDCDTVVVTAPAFSFLAIKWD